MSFGGSKSKSKSSEQQTATLDPLARSALQQVITGAGTLQKSNDPIVANFDPATIAGIQGLQDRPQSSFIPAGEQALTANLSGAFLTPGAFGASLDQLGQTLSGQNIGQNPGISGFNPQLGAVEDRIRKQASQAVADRFTSAGRTGSPAEANSIARSVTESLAPFSFGALEAQQGRQFQGFENERQRQIAASQIGLNQFNTGISQQLQGLSLAPTFEGLQDAQSNRLLQAGSLIQQQNQNVLDEPFLRFERFANPLIAAAGGFPVDLTRKSKSSGTTFSASI